jgi:hypothetical protein
MSLRRGFPPWTQPPHHPQFLSVKRLVGPEVLACLFLPQGMPGFAHTPTRTAIPTAPSAFPHSPRFSRYMGFTDLVLLV